MNIVIAAGLLDIDPGLFVWVLITFVLFVLLLGKFAWKPILQALGERENSIKESLEAADKALKRAEQVSQDNEQALKDAEAAAHKIRKEALEDAENLRKARLEKVEEEAQKLISEARTSIEKEKKQALSELREEVASMVIEATKRVVKAEIDEKKSSKIVDEFIQDLAKN